MTARSESCCPDIQRARHSSTPELESRKARAQQLIWDEMQEASDATSTGTSPMMQPPSLVWSTPPVSKISEPPDSLEEQAMSYLFTSGILSILSSTVSETNPTDAIYEMCQETSPTSSLNRAVKAIALANLANRMYQPELRMQALNEYDKALVALKAVLADGKKCLEDQTLATLLVMRVCEVSTKVGVEKLWEPRVLTATVTLRIQFSNLHSFFRLHASRGLAESRRRHARPFAY